MLQLVQLYRGMGQLSTQNLYTTPDQTNRRNLEQLCASANLAVVDGSEKINRPICSAPKSKVFLPQQHIYMTQCCIQSPASGGRFRKPSKYCEMHLFFWEDQAAASTADTNLPTPHSPNPILEKDKVGSLPNNDSTDLLVGCRKSKGVTRFHDRTAGVLAIVRPCVIVNTCKMYTCESPTQVYLFLVMTFARGRDIDPTALPWI